MRALVGIVVVASIAFVAYRLLQSEQGRQAVQQAAQQATRAAQRAADLAVDGVDVGGELNGLVGKASAALGGITDQASAQAALPGLQEVKGKLDGLTARIDELPAEGRRLLATAVGAALPGLKALAAKVGSVPGAEPIGPTLDAVLAKLEGWAKAPAT